jgi:hypothetical protein
LIPRLPEAVKEDQQRDLLVLREVIGDEDRDPRREALVALQREIEDAEIGRRPAREDVGVAGLSVAIARERAGCG